MPLSLHFIYTYINLKFHQLLFTCAPILLNFGFWQEKERLAQEEERRRIRKEKEKARKEQRKKAGLAVTAKVCTVDFYLSSFPLFPLKKKEGV